MLKRWSSCSQSTAPRKKSQQIDQDLSGSRDDSFASPKKTTDWHRAGAGGQDGTGTSDPAVVVKGTVGKPLPLTLVSASRHLLSLVLTREMLASAHSVPVVYQVTMDLLCLSVPTSLLVQDFARAVSFIALLSGQAAEPVTLLALNSCVSLPHSVEVGLALG